MNPYTEDQLVEQPAIALFDELDWETASAMGRDILARRDCEDKA